MKTQLAIICALGASLLPAQTPHNVMYRSAGPEIALQQSGWFSAATPAIGTTFTTHLPGLQPIAGKPFSAKEERRTLQVLGDGTRIERNESGAYYRDDQGRTRVEHTTPMGLAITISDPVAGYTVILEPGEKIARKLPMPPAGNRMRMVTSMEHGVAVGGVAGAKAVHADMVMTGPTAISHRVIAKPSNATPPANESLGTNVVNGVSADGTRTTFIIPVGEIGNDREIRTVSERWFSQDLQMMVKSSSTDPRFGENTYELTNIVRVAPDPALFLIPADYTVQEMGKVREIVEVKK